MIGHRNLCEPAWQTRRASRDRRGQTAAHGGAGAMHETRAPGIRPDSTLQISLAKIDIPTPGSLPTSHVPHRTWTTSPPEVGASSTTQRHSADARGPCARGPCIGHKPGQHDGHHPATWTIGRAGADHSRNFQRHDTSGHQTVRGPRNAIPHPTTCVTKSFPTRTLLAHALLTQGYLVHCFLLHFRCLLNHGILIANAYCFSLHCT